jgi:hypothetical protein
VYEGKQFCVVDPDPDSTYHPNADTDADPDSEFLFVADLGYQMMRIRMHNTENLKV